jgi:hypothetical protein
MTHRGAVVTPAPMKRYWNGGKDPAALVCGDKRW